jgi:hypothetical protein
VGGLLALEPQQGLLVRHPLSHDQDRIAGLCVALRVTGNQKKKKDFHNKNSEPVKREDRRNGEAKRDQTHRGIADHEVAVLGQQRLAALHNLRRDLGKLQVA